jgi:hypothetical protein
LVPDGGHPIVHNPRAVTALKPKPLIYPRLAVTLLTAGGTELMDGLLTGWRKGGVDASTAAQKPSAPRMFSRRNMKNHSSKMLCAKYEEPFPHNYGPFAGCFRMFNPTN